MQRDALIFGALSGARAEVSNRIYSAQAAFATYHEFVAIITSRVAFILFHSHRFVLNLGYNFEDGPEAPIAVTIVIVSMVIELSVSFKRSESLPFSQDEERLTVRTRLSLRPSPRACEAV